MPSVLHACRHCRKPLPAEATGAPALMPCPACGTKQLIRAYPAAAVPAGTQTVPDATRGTEQAGCFNHPGRPAEELCADCGRFICTLCVLELQQRLLCPACLSKCVAPETATAIVRRQPRYDKIAMMLAWLPLFFWPVTLFTGPATVVIGIRHWKRPGSLPGFGRLRLALALLFGMLQTAGWLLMAGWLIFGRNQ